MQEWSLPRNLVDAAHREGRQAWLSTLPQTVRTLEQHWSLEVGPPFQPGGQTAWVGPARDAKGSDLVLKVAWRHSESAHEAEGLRHWHGDGAVEIYRAEKLDDADALLIERCVPGTTLASRSEPEQDMIIAGLLGRLWVETDSGHPFRPLEHLCDAWADSFEEKSVGRLNLDAGLAREGIWLLRQLPRTAAKRVLLCTDLHAGNVLAAKREPWLVIDPKPYVGDPAYDLIQHLLNCDQRLRTDPRHLAWRVADLAGIDRDRVLSWLFARCVQESCDWPELAEVASVISPD